MFPRREHAAEVQKNMYGEAMKHAEAQAGRAPIAPPFLRQVFLRWRARARLVQTLAGRRGRRESFFAARRSWWQRVLEDESLRAAALRALCALLRWAVRGRGAGRVGVAIGVAGTLLLEGPVGISGLTDGDAAGAGHA